MRRHGEHGAGEVLHREGLAADAAGQGWLGLHAGQALPEAVGVLLRGAQDQHVLAAADSAGDHGAVGDVGPAVDVEVQQHRAPCFCFFGRVSAGFSWELMCFFVLGATHTCLEQRRHHMIAGGGATSCLGCCGL